MKTDLQCTPCIIRQSLNTLKLSGCDEESRRKVMKKLLRVLEKMDYNDNPAFNSNPGYHIMSEVTGIKDPYHKMKLKYNAAALEIYPELEDIVNNSKDKLHTAAKIAVAGNVIDFGIHLSGGRSLHLADVIDEIKNIPLSRDDFDIFFSDFHEAEKILYIADNAGEIVFDRMFINQMVNSGKSVILAVKSGPIINDATFDDACQVELDKIVEIVETGNNCIGVNLKLLSEDFKKAFIESDIIISKGQGNFETLDNIRNRKIFFLLKAKCEIIARELGVNYLDIVFMKSKHYK